MHSGIPDIEEPGQPVVFAHTAVPPRKAVAAAVAGNALEFYDFLSYAFFAVDIGKTFFPVHSSYMSLLLSLAVFGFGFFARPVGGVVFGLMGDRVGRRASLILTLVLMTLGTLGVALTPSYASIGLAAPGIVVFARLVQGFALGGEIGPSSAFLIEAAPKHRRGLYASWQFASQGAGILLAGIMGLLFGRLLGQEAMLAWGWRAAFLLGLLVVPLALYLRRSMPETLHARSAGPRPHRAPARYLVIAIGVILGGTVSAYVGSYMTTYAIATLGMPPTAAMAATVALGLFTLVFSVVGGLMCDRYGRKPTLLWPRVVSALVTVPAFRLLDASPGVLTLVLVTSALAAINALSGAATLVAVPEVFERRHRALGLGVAYAIGVSIFGGTTQFLVTWLIHATADPIAPAWYATAASVVAIAAMLMMPETRNEDA